MTYYYYFSLKICSPCLLYSYMTWFFIKKMFFFFFLILYHMLCYMMMILRCILFDFELIICFGVTLCDEGLLLYIYIYIYIYITLVITLKWYVKINWYQNIIFQCMNHNNHLNGIENFDFYTFFSQNPIKIK